MKRYAFIDVSNTKSTTKMALGFSIDWDKLYKVLMGEKWDCKKIFYYEGSMEISKYDKRHFKLTAYGYIVKTKKIFLHKVKEKMARFLCSSCTKENQIPVTGAKFACIDCGTLNTKNGIEATHNPKANFDVEITADVLEYAGSDNEILLFTGDGDFRYLIEKLLEKGTMITIVSTSKKSLDGSYRLSTRLKDLITEEEERVKKIGTKSRVRLIEIDNWKFQIQK